MSKLQDVKINFENTSPVYSNDNITIEIPLQEYKELLEYKGRYLELKDNYYYKPYIPSWPTITYTGDPKKESEYPYKVTCDTNCCTTAYNDIKRETL